MYSRGKPANERVIFDLGGEFAAAMTDRITGDNWLLPFWDVDMNSFTINTPNVYFSNPHHPFVPKPQVGNPVAIGVKPAWLGLSQGAPYPDPNASKLA